MKTVEEEKKKKGLFVQKKAIAKLRPHQMTGASQRAHAVARERQNSNKQSSVYL